MTIETIKYTRKGDVNRGFKNEIRDSRVYPSVTRAVSVVQFSRANFHPGPPLLRGARFCFVFVCLFGKALL